MCAVAQEVSLSLEEVSLSLEAQVSGVLLDPERAPSNVICILFDYMFFRIKRALFILFNGN